MADPKAPEKVTPIVVEGFEINAPNVTFQRLQEFSLTLFERLLLQRSERNFLMLDRDRLLTALTNLRHEIREVESAAVNKEVELERAQQRFRQDKRELQQELKYLEYDHKLTLEQLGVWEGGLITKVDDENLKEMLELLEEKRQLKMELMTSEMKFEEQLTNLKKQHGQAIMELQKKNERIHIHKEMEFKRDLIEMKEEMTLRHEMEMSELEERKNCHLMELRNIHKKRLDELKNFFNSVTAENLAVISSIKQCLDGVSKTKVTMTKEMDKLKKNKNKLQKPLENTKTEVKNLTRQLTNYQKDLLSLKNNERMLNETYNELDKIKNESIAALNCFNRSIAMTPEECLDRSCLTSLVQFRNSAAAKRKQLEELAEQMLIAFHKKRIILRELSGDPDFSQAISQLNFEQWSPTKLNFELNLAKKAYDEALSALEEKLIEFCSPESTLGHGSWKVLPGNSGPAGLVSKQ